MWCYSLARLPLTTTSVPPPDPVERCLYSNPLYFYSLPASDSSGDSSSNSVNDASAGGDLILINVWRRLPIHCRGDDTSLTVCRSDELTTDQFTDHCLLDVHCWTVGELAPIDVCRTVLDTHRCTGCYASCCCCCCCCCQWRAVCCRVVLTADDIQSVYEVNTSRCNINDSYSTCWSTLYSAVVNESLITARARQQVTSYTDQKLNRNSNRRLWINDIHILQCLW